LQNGEAQLIDNTVVTIISALDWGLQTFNHGTDNRGTVKCRQLINGKLIAWTHNRADT